MKSIVFLMTVILLSDALAGSCPDELKEKVQAYYAIRPAIDSLSNSFDHSQEGADHEIAIKAELARQYEKLLTGDTLEGLKKYIGRYSYYSEDFCLLLPEKINGIKSFSCRTNRKGEKILEAKIIRISTYSPLTNIQVKKLELYYTDYKISTPGIRDLKSELANSENSDLEIESEVEKTFTFIKENEEWKIKNIDEKIISSLARITK
ncbi:hypothetical protein GF382_02310 [Candidatus Falkowbacteria bacterium]|nr:hypothetical protein [Candidatus Falkowbacteria bacterium]